jgi:2-polyprenyl-3-methyl-5-hydroxy-6-metoxy-1,4-benzoquinol methylase
MINDNRKNIEVVCPLCKSINTNCCRRYSDYSFFSCKNCELEFVHPFKGTSDVFSNYPWTLPYTQQYVHYLKLVKYSVTKKIEIAQNIINKKIESFYDVGCGNGAHCEAVKELGLITNGNDIDPTNVNFAKNRGLNVSLGSLENLNIIEKYDFIHVKLTFHLLENPIDIIQKLKHILSPKGVIFIDLPNQSSIYSLLRKISIKSEYGQLQPPARNRAYYLSTIKLLTQKTGLKITKYVYFCAGDPIYYPSLHLDIKAKIIFLLSKLGLNQLMGFYLTDME